MAGVDLRTVAELMGHKTLQTVMRYAHLAPEHNANAVAKLDSLLNAPSRMVAHDSASETDTKTDTRAKASLNLRIDKSSNYIKIRSLRPQGALSSAVRAADS